MQRQSLNFVEENVKNEVRKEIKQIKEIALGGHKPEIITLNSKIKDSQN